MRAPWIWRAISIVAARSKFSIRFALMERRSSHPVLPAVHRKLNHSTIRRLSKTIAPAREINPCDPWFKVDQTTILQVFSNCTCAGYSRLANASWAPDDDTAELSSWTTYGGHCKNPLDECDVQYRQYLFVLTLCYCVSFVFQTARILLPMR